MSDRSKVVPGGNAEERTRAFDMVEAGHLVRTYVTAAMDEQHLSLAEVARQSGIAASAWHAWFRGDHQPRRNSLVLAGRTLQRTPDHLAAAWAGGRVRASAAPVDALHQTGR